MDDGPRRLPRLRERLPGLLIEAFSVAFAVLLALAVDEWREDRSNRELADRAVQSVLEEVRTNLSRLEDGAQARDSLRSYLVTTRESLDRGEELESITVNFQPAFLASTAWETARVTRAVHFMDYDRVARIGRLYEFQDLYVSAEQSFVDLLAGIVDADWSEPAEAIRVYDRGMARVDGFADQLQNVYASVLKDEFDEPSDGAGSGTVELEP